MKIFRTIAKATKEGQFNKEDVVNYFLVELENGQFYFIEKFPEFTEPITRTALPTIKDGFRFFFDTILNDKIAGSTFKDIEIA